MLTHLLAHRRAYWLVAIPTMVLSLGANVVVLSITNAIHYRPAPVKDVASVVVPMRDLMSNDDHAWSALGLELLAAELGAQGFAGQTVTTGDYAALRPAFVMPSTGRRLDIVGVTDGFFDVLGIPLRGTAPINAMAADERAVPAVISDGLWQTVFGGRLSAIGSKIDGGAHILRVVGIAPKGFTGARMGESTDVWVPHQSSLFVSSEHQRVSARAPLIGLIRLGPATTVPAAQNHLAQSARASFRGLSLVPLRTVFGSSETAMVAVDGDSVISLSWLTAMAVLFAGCATLSALMVTTFERRKSEWAIRMALGAGRRTIIQSVSVELLWMLVIGVLLTLAGVAVVVRLLPDVSIGPGVVLSRLDLIPDWRVAGLTLAVGVLMVLVATVTPLARATASHSMGLLLGRAGWHVFDGARTRRAMLVVQVAVTMVVCVVAIHLVRTVNAGVSGSGGFSSDTTLFARVQTGYPTGEPDAEAALRMARLAAATDLAISRISALPGVSSIAAGGSPLGPVPTSRRLTQRTFVIEAGEVRLPVGVAFAGPGYCDALGVQTMVGTCPSSVAETLGGRAVVVTPLLADQLWPGVNPVGQSLSLPNRPLTVVGVVDMAFGSIKFGRSAAMWIFEAGFLTGFEINMVVRAQDAAEARPAIIEELRRTFGDDAPMTVATGTEVVASDLGRERLGARLFSGFGVVAALLAFGGLCSLVSFLVSSHRTEFALRAALGAQPKDLLLLGSLFGIAPAGMGIVIGSIGAVMASNLAAAWVMGLQSAPLATVLMVAASMACTAAVVSIALCVRVSRTSPRLLF